MRGESQTQDNPETKEHIIYYVILIGNRRQPVQVTIFAGSRNA